MVLIGDVIHLRDFAPSSFEYVSPENVELARARIESVGFFRNRTKEVVNSSWSNMGIVLNGSILIEEHPTMSISKFSKTEDFSREHHHIFPKTFAAILQQFPEAVDQVRCLFPCESLGRILLQNPHHVLNALPIDNYSHTFLHRPPYVEGLPEIIESDHIIRTSEDEFSREQLYRIYCNLFGLPDWYHELDYMFFALNVIALREKYFRGNRPRTSLQPSLNLEFLMDIDTVYKDMLCQHPEMMMGMTRMLIEAGVVRNVFREG